MTPTPEPNERRARQLTVFPLLVWALVTIAARPLHPIVADGVERVEVALGLDVVKAPPE